MTKKAQIEQDEAAQEAPAVIDAVSMIRPEDRSAEPVIAQVRPDEVEHWKSHGWIIKE